MKAISGFLVRRAIVINNKARSMMRKIVIRFAYPTVQIESSAVVGKGVTIRATDGGRIYIGHNVNVSAGCEIVAQGANLTIGNQVFIGRGSFIVARAGLAIGSDCQIAEYVTIRDQDHVWGGGQVGRVNEFAATPIEIGDDVWIGAKATVLRGSVVGSHSIVGANAVVKGIIPKSSIAVGVPARVLPSVA